MDVKWERNGSHLTLDPWDETIDYREVITSAFYVYCQTSKEANEDQSVVLSSLELWPVPWLPCCHLFSSTAILSEACMHKNSTCWHELNSVECYQKFSPLITQRTGRCLTIARLKCLLTRRQRQSAHLDYPHICVGKCVRHWERELSIAST